MRLSVPTKKEVEMAVIESLKRLVHDDRYLLENDVNERSLSHRFAIYLQERVDKWKEDWKVDCEYNRIGEDQFDPKKINLLKSEAVDLDDTDARTVFPDIIVHLRGVSGKNGGNLLVVEFKKSTSKVSDAFDREDKLPAYLKQLRYFYAAFVKLKCKNQFDYELEWIK